MLSIDLPWKWLRVCFELQEMQKCFDDKDIQMLQDAITKMDPTVS